MASAFLTIWLGGCLPLRALENLIHLLQLLEQSDGTYSAGRQGKELLINHVGGFTGYQKTAHQLAPSNAAAWASCASRYGLRAYAPQLGWKTYGFGAIDQLIDVGQRLQSQTASATAAARAELPRLAQALAIRLDQLQPIAVFSAQLHSLLSKAHHKPQRRAQHLVQLVALCASFTPTG